MTLERFVRPIVEIKKGEWSKTILTFLYFYLTITAYYILKPARNSLYINYLGADNIPYAVIFIAVILISIPGFIPTPEYGTGEYNYYMDVRSILANTWRLLINIGIALIASVLFLGAFRLKKQSEQAKRGMYIAFGIVILSFILSLVFLRYILLIINN